MSLFPIVLPPGFHRNGTEYQSKGRWHDGNLVRFYQGVIMPIGGWRVKSDDVVTGTGRAILSWADNDEGTGTAWTAIGTEVGLFAMTRTGAVHDITPVGFTPGRVDAEAEGGFGSGYFGEGFFGTPRPDTTTIQEASMWSLDHFGENLVGVMADDGIIYEWTLDTETVAEAVANAPTADSLFVTEEGMLVALGADGNARRVAWSDQQDNTLWAADATNQAGDYDLQTKGAALQGFPVTGGNLIITSSDVWTMNYTGDERSYAIKRAGEGCGGISRKCGVSLDSQAVWMGKTGFWLWNGYVQPLPCDVWDYVFKDINTLQMSKVTCRTGEEYGEVTWRYPSAGSIEVDRYVTWNYRENHFVTGILDVMSAVDEGPSQYPLSVRADGYIYEDEVGNEYGGSMPWLESGPFEFGDGDYCYDIVQLLPDEATSGDVNVTFLVRFTPQGEETSYGPFPLSAYTDVRFSGRQARMRYDGVRNSDWRVGTPRVDGKKAGER